MGYPLFQRSPNFWHQGLISMEDNFPTDQGAVGGGGDFRMVPAHSIYYALHFQSNATVI